MKSKAAPNLELQRERFRQQMNRSALARQTGLARKTLIDIEQRNGRVRFDSAARIAKALDKNIDDLFECGEVIG